MERKSDLFIIEVLRPEDYACFAADGLQLVNQMQALGFDTRYVRAYTFDSFKRAIAQFKESKFKWLHLSCHGCENGVEFYEKKRWEDECKFDPDIITNADVAKAFGGSLLQCRMTLSGCKMGNAGFVKKMFGSNKGLQSLVAPIEDLKSDMAAPLWLTYYSLLINRARSKYRGDNVKITSQDIGDVIESVTKCFFVPLAFNEYHPEKSADNPNPSVSRKVSTFSSWKDEDKNFHVY